MPAICAGGEEVPEEDIKRLLEEVRRSLEQSQRSLKAIEERSSRKSTPPPPPPAAAAPENESAASPASVSYKRRKTASYDKSFLTQGRAPAQLPAPPPSDEVEWASGERPAALPPPPAEALPPGSSRYAIIQPRLPKKR